MEYRDYIIILYDYYRELFNEKQQEYFEDYYFNNLSLQEISENVNVSRNAIHKAIKSMEEKLQYYEEKLSLYSRSKEIRKLLTNVSDDIKMKIEELLKKAIAPIRDQYDYIIIDCPPSLGLLNTNALTAADSILIPVQCEYFALEGLTQLLSTIRLVQKLWNPHLSIEGVLLTMFDVRTRLSVEIQQEVKKYFKEKVYKSIIPRNVKLSEAPSVEQSIFEYDTRCDGAKAYAQLVKEVIVQNTKEGNY